ncbi:hypothetical protein I6N96_04215 [Enterococcus sp. BWM-S5]|uniref:Uncharacterized protein n=1 Tax=Enterococcus larvae TaxID=2794352 RepID=A0ABS4CGA1_9ENTE|nr:hypothetical protein [Enterococcus larvae]MBP1045469.1 hypothetical protein [Enterococcus larvae]
MYTDRELNELNQEVYFVDPDFDEKITYKAKPTSELSGNEKNVVIINDKKFQIVGSANIDNNGYQGFAVAPITVDYPQGDPNNVAIISAGTVRPAILGGEGSDGFTDFIAAAGVFDTKNGGSPQTKQAEDFVDYMINVKGYTVTHLSGYSQSAYMLKIGAQFGIPTTVFNGWFLYDSLTDDEKKFMKDNPELFRNYRKYKDIRVKLIDGNDMEKIGEDFGTIFWVEGDTHEINDWFFDKDGNVLFKDSKSSVVKMSQIARQASLDKWRLFQLKKKFSTSGGGLSANEQIYLDDSEALLVVEAASRMSKTILESVKEKYQKAIIEAEQLWQKTEQTALNVGSTLSNSEAIEALESGGATKQALTTEPISYYQEKISQLNAQNTAYDSLASDIKASIAKLVSSDLELAGQL